MAPAFVAVRRKSPDLLFFPHFVARIGCSLFQQKYRYNPNKSKLVSKPVKNTFL